MSEYVFEECESCALLYSRSGIMAFCSGCRQNRNTIEALTAELRILTDSMEGAGCWGALVKAARKVAEPPIYDGEQYVTYEGRPHSEVMGELRDALKAFERTERKTK